jgi:hypothetical protein
MLKPKKRDSGHPAFPVGGNTAFKFDKTADTGPMDYGTMDPESAKTIHEERVRRQIQSRLKRGGK